MQPLEAFDERDQVLDTLLSLLESTHIPESERVAGLPRNPRPRGWRTPARHVVAPLALEARSVDQQLQQQATGCDGSIDEPPVAPEIENRAWLKSTAVFAKLPELQKRLRELERKVESLLGRQPPA